MPVLCHMVEKKLYGYGTPPQYRDFIDGIIGYIHQLMNVRIWSLQFRFMFSLLTLWGRSGSTSEAAIRDPHPTNYEFACFRLGPNATR